MRRVEIIEGVANVTVQFDSASATAHAVEVLAPKVDQLGDLREKLRETLENIDACPEATEALDLDVARMQYQVKELVEALVAAGEKLSQDKRDRDAFKEKIA